MSRLKITVADSDVACRTFFVKILEKIPGIELAWTSPNYESVLRKMRKSPIELIILDSSLADMDTLNEFENEFPDTRVLLLTTTNEENSEIKQLKNVVGTLLKPGKTPVKSDEDEIVNQLKSILKPFTLLMNLDDIRETDTDSNENVRIPKLNNSIKIPSKVDAVLIGASTGGPDALKKLLSGFHQDFPIPILIVLHMPKTFTGEFAQDLDSLSNLTVLEADSGMEVRAGHAYLAPGDKHLKVLKTSDKTILHLSDDPPVNSCRPAVDVLFKSAVKAYDSKKLLCVIMTGIGSDGVDGVAVIQNSGGGYCLTQSEESCVVYGMPKNTVKRGLSSEVVALDNLATRIQTIARHS